MQNSSPKRRYPQPILEKIEEEAEARLEAEGVDLEEADPKKIAAAKVTLAPIATGIFNTCCFAFFLIHLVSSSCFHR